jgi:hypothetical protein
MLAYTVKIIFLDELQPQYLPYLGGLGIGIKDIFLSESSNAISISLSADESPMFSSMVPSVNPGLLADVAAARLQNGPGPVKELGLIFASTYYRDVGAIAPKWLGVMFDTDIVDGSEYFWSGPSRRPRECCAIFTSSIEIFARNRGLSLGRVLARTAVHELGHLFNLHHPSIGSYFMTQTGSIKDDSTAYSRFSEEDRKVLSSIETPGYEFAQPGTREFGDLFKG